MSLVRPRGFKKTVSFTVQPTESQEEEFHPSVSIPGLYTSPLLLPMHHLLIIIGLFKDGLTQNPLRVMVKGALVLLAVQLVYGYVLSVVSGADSNKEKRGKKQSRNFSSHVAKVLVATLVSLLFTPVAFVVLVLFGAPLYGYLAETYILGVHLSLMIVQPLLIIFGMDFEQLYSVAKSATVFKLIFTNPILCSSFFCVLGTWLGVVPIPLDWDRPWQQWPITLLAGGYGGCVLGLLIGYISQYL